MQVARGQTVSWSRRIRGRKDYVFLFFFTAALGSLFDYYSSTLAVIGRWAIATRIVAVVG